MYYYSWKSFITDIGISKKGITRPLLSRSWLNLFLKILSAKEVKSCATPVKRERKSRGLVIPIFDIFLKKSRLSQKFYDFSPEILWNFFSFRFFQKLTVKSFKHKLRLRKPFFNVKILLWLKNDEHLFFVFGQNHSKNTFLSL
jgi:hypothetical protein